MEGHLGTERKIVSAPIFRITVSPDDENGLRMLCQIQIDKIITVRKDKLGPVFGKISNGLMIAVNRSLAIFLGF
jgi:mRNA interferase MazF